MRMAIESGQHNQTRGHALSVIIIQTLPGLIIATGEVSMWTLTTTIANRYNFGKSERARLYDRIRSAVRELEAAKLITTDKRYDRATERTIKYIRPCSAN